MCIKQLFMGFQSQFNIPLHLMQDNGILHIFQHFGQLGIVCRRSKIEFHQKWTPNSESAPEIYIKQLCMGFQSQFNIPLTQYKIMGIWHIFWYFGQLGLVCRRPNIEFHQEWTPNSESAPEIYIKQLCMGFQSQFNIPLTQYNIIRIWHIFQYFGQLGVVWRRPKIEIQQKSTPNSESAPEIYIKQLCMGFQSQFNIPLPLYKIMGIWHTFWYFGQLGVVWRRPKIEFHQKWTPNSESAPKICI